jgi:hypothetical protein
MLKTVCFISLVTIILNNSIAQDNVNDSLPFVKKEMCIILSTQKYSEALYVAKVASKKLNTKIKLGNLKPNKDIGLTMPKLDCEGNGWDYPCYVARGRWDDGAYISIEYSSAIDGFAAGYFIVIIASGDKSITIPALNSAKKHYKTAYVKTANIYVGCLH